MISSLVSALLTQAGIGRQHILVLTADARRPGFARHCVAAVPAWVALLGSAKGE